MNEEVTVSLEELWKNPRKWLGKVVITGGWDRRKMGSQKQEEMEWWVNMDVNVSRSAFDLIDGRYVLGGVDERIEKAWIETARFGTPVKANYYWVLGVFYEDKERLKKTREEELEWFKKSNWESWQRRLGVSSPEEYVRRLYPHDNYFSPIVFVGFEEREVGR
jgi:hypothetical protein